MSYLFIYLNVWNTYVCLISYSIQLHFNTKKVARSIFLYFQQFTTFAFVACVNFRIFLEFNLFGLQTWFLNSFHLHTYSYVRIRFELCSDHIALLNEFWMNFQVTFRIKFFFKTGQWWSIMWLNTVYIWKCGTTTVFTCDFLNVVCTDALLICLD